LRPIERTPATVRRLRRRAARSGSDSTTEELEGLEDCRAAILQIPPAATNATRLPLADPGRTPENPSVARPPGPGAGPARWWPTGRASQDRVPRRPFVPSRPADRSDACHLGRRASRIRAAERGSGATDADAPRVT